jgi:hypothetical protein
MIRLFCERYGWLLLRYGCCQSALEGVNAMDRMKYGYDYWDDLGDRITILLSASISFSLAAYAYHFARYFGGTNRHSNSLDKKWNFTTPDFRWYPDTQVGSKPRTG